MSKNDSYLTKTNTDSKQKLDNLLDKPIISIKEAKKLLGANYGNESNAQISEIVCALRAIAEVLLAMAASSTKQNGGV